MQTRTAKMFTYAEEHAWTFTKAKQYVTVQGKEFRLLSRTIHHYTNEPLVSFGSHTTRELLLLDPASPLLQSLYAELKGQIDKSKPIETILKQTMIFVRNQFLKTSDAEIIQVANSTGNRYKGNPVAYLDDFIKAKTGFCRHQALLLSYLLDSLMQDPDNLLPKGTIYTHRDDIITEQSDKPVAHTWIMLQFDHSKQLFHLDSQWYDEPHLLEGNLETNPHLCKYGVETAKDCWVRYSANPAPPSPQNEYKIADETFTVTDVNGSFTCELTAENKKFTYGIDKPLGTGSFGKVYAMTSKDAFAPPIVVKSFTVKNYPSTASDQEIADALKIYFNLAKHEAEYNKMVGGIGVFYVVNAQAPIKTKIITHPNGTSHQELVDPPRAYIAIKKEQGVPLDRYTIISPAHYLTFCIAAVKSLQQFHAKQLVHSDIHKGNILVEEIKTEPYVVVNYVDMTLCDYEGTLLSTRNLDLSIKPPEFKGQPSVIRNKKQDIYCLGRVFKEKNDNDGYFSEPMKSQVKKIFNDMLKIDPRDRPDTYEILNELRSLLFILQFKTGNADNLIKNLKNISDANERLTTLRKLKTNYPGYIAKLSDLNVNDLVSLWDNDQQKNEVLQLLFNDKLSVIKSSAEADSDNALNEILYCTQLLLRLDNKGKAISIQEAIASYQKLQSSTLKDAESVASYLENGVERVESFIPCLKQLTASQQYYLFTHGEPQTLRNLVNKTNVCELLFDASQLDPTQRLSTYLINKLGDDHVKNALKLKVDDDLNQFKTSLSQEINSILCFKDLSYQLTNNTITVQDVLARYKEIFISGLKEGKGAAYYLQNVVKTANNLALCLKQLTPAQQCYLFTHGEPHTLRNLVNETNLFDVINATRHSDILIKKLGNDYIKSKLQLVIAAKLAQINSPLQPDSDNTINERFCCKRILFRLENNDAIEDVLENYRFTVLSSAVDVGRGAAYYLKSVTDFALCLKQLTPNEQRYLFTHGEPEILRGLVNNTNLFDIINATQHSNILFKKLEHHVKYILQMMLDVKLTKIKSSPHADFASAINERFYCEQALLRLKNENAIEEAIVCYLTLQSSDLQDGKGALRYLENVVKTADNLVPCLNQLTPNQQLYLFTHGQLKTLSNLVNENNFLSILKNTPHANILLRKLDSQKRNQMIELMVRDRLANSTFKEAVKSFDTWNNDPALHKEILLVFNHFYYQRRDADPRSSYHLLNLFSKDDKLQACRALEREMTPDDWKQHKGALRGDLGEVGQRLKKLAHVRLGSF